MADNDVQIRFLENPTPFGMIKLTDNTLKRVQEGDVFTFIAVITKVDPLIADGQSVVCLIEDFSEVTE